MPNLLLTSSLILSQSRRMSEPHAPPRFTSTNAWREDAEDAGANVVDTLIVNNEPDDEGLASCAELGAALA